MGKRVWVQVPGSVCGCVCVCVKERVSAHLQESVSVHVQGVFYACAVKCAHICLCALMRTWKVAIVLNLWRLKLKILFRFGCAPGKSKTTCIRHSLFASTNDKVRKH